MRYCQNCGKELPRGRYNTCDGKCFQELTDKRQRELDEKYGTYHEQIPDFTRGTKSMSKPDFFLPFHLPMVAEGENIIYNIELPLKDESDKVRNDIYFCRLFKGVYQTIRIHEIWTDNSEHQKMFPFSISLN